MSKTSFKNYLLNQINRKDRIGSLAKKFKVSKEISFEELYNYLFKIGDDEDLFALRAAYEEYEAAQENN